MNVSLTNTFSHVAILCVLLASSVAFAEQPFALFIRAQEQTLKSGTDIKVSVTLQNVTAREIGILKTTPEFDYQVEVKDANGKIMPDTDYGRKLKAPGTVHVSASAIVVPLKPNEILEDVIAPSELYEMTAPAQYTIRVLRVIPPDIGKGTVSSNTISVTVVP